MILRSVILLLLLVPVSVLSYKCDVPSTTLTSPELPSLPTEYEVHVEANIVQKSKTIEVKEYYDYYKNKATIEIVTNGKLYTSIINFEQMERYDIHPDKSCDTQDLTNSSTSIFGFFVDNDSSHMHTVSDVFKFGQKFNETYIGQSVIRGIPVNQWRSCQRWENKNTNFTLDYYFSTADYQTASGAKQIPIRAVLTGIAGNVNSEGKPLPGTHNFTHIYDFILFKPSIQDTTVFQVPRGVVCKGRKPTLPMPELPDHFSVDIELDNKYTVSPSTQTIYYDYKYKLIRSDYSHYDERPTQMSFISKVEDYSSGSEYIINKLTGNCTIKNIDNQSFGSRERHGQLVIRTSKEILQYNDRHYIYQGARIWRGLSSLAWANQSDGIIQEILFLKVSDTSNPVLVGLYIKNNSKKHDTTPNRQSQGEENEQFIHFYNYKSTPNNIHVYDVSGCYHEESKLNIQLTITGDRDAESLSSYFKTTTLRHIAKLCHISVLRLINIQTKVINNNIVVSFTILENASFLSDTISSQQAYENLKYDSQNDSQYLVDFTNQTKKFTILPGSIKQVTDDIDPASGHSTGMVVGSSVIMFITGLVIGVFTVLLIYKRRLTKKTTDSTVPYTRSKD